MNEKSNQQINNSNSSGDIVNRIAGISSDTAKVNARFSFTIKDARTVAQQFSSIIVNRAVPSIGSRTGNYVLQDQVQSGVRVAAKIIDVGLAFAINPVVGALSLVGEGFGLAFEVAQRNREIMWQNRAASELARRAGYLSDSNR